MQLHMHDAISYPHPHPRVVERQHMVKRRARGRKGTRGIGGQAEKRGSGVASGTQQERKGEGREEGGFDSHRGVSLLVIIHLSNRSAITIWPLLLHSIPVSLHRRSCSPLSASPRYPSLSPWAWLTSNQSVSISEPLLDDCVGNHCSRLITEIPYPLIRSNENVARY